MGGEGRAGALLGVHHRDVVRGVALELQPDVLDARLRAEDELGDGVREVRGAARAEIDLLDDRARALAGDDEGAGVGGDRPRRGVGEEDERDGRVHRDVGRELEEGAVLEEGRVGGDEGVVPDAGEPAEVRRHAVRQLAERLRQRGEHRGARQPAAGGELGAEAPVQEDEAGPLLRGGAGEQRRGPGAVGLAGAAQRERREARRGS